MQKKYFDGLIDYDFSIFFDNLRDVNRYLNIFRFKKNALLNKVNKTDLAVLTALEIFEPKIYNYLKNNKDSLYEFKKNFTTALELSKRVNKNYLGKLLSKLFPNMEDENIEIERTIKNRDYFEAYFSLSIDSKIYNKKVDDFLEKLVNKEQFILEINNV